MTEAQYATMLDYFEDKLSAEEEAAFMQEVNGSEIMQQEFHQELILRYGLDKESILNNLSGGQQDAFESPDKHIAGIKKILEEKNPEEEVTDKSEETVPVKKMFDDRLVKIAAAVILIIISGIVTYNLVKSYDKPSLVKQQPNIPKKDSLQENIDTVRKPNEPENVILADAGVLYKQAYKDYRPGTDDPVEISYYLQEYIKGNYKEVTGATRNDYETRGISSDKNEAYMQLYKGLSYLKAGSADSALFHLQSAEKKSQKIPHVQYNATWYIALTYLKKNDREKAKNVFRNIIHQEKSPYHKEAETLLDQLQ